jgi:hypothetical protein
VCDTRVVGVDGDGLLVVERNDVEANVGHAH